MKGQGWGKNWPQTKMVKGQHAKKLTTMECWLMQGEEADEKTQLILWTERPTGVVMEAGALQPATSKLMSPNIAH